MMLCIIYDRLDTDEYLKADKRNYHKLAPKIDALGFTQVSFYQIGETKYQNLGFRIYPGVILSNKKKVPDKFRINDLPITTTSHFNFRFYFCTQVSIENA